MTEPGAGDAGDRAARLWVAVQQELVRRAAHELKNALNGAAVNLEVVRGRLARPGTPAEAATRFAESAAAELERVSAFVESLLALGRPAREPPDVAGVLGSLRPLLEAGAAANDIALGVAALEPGTRPTAADAQVTRLVLAAALLAATAAGARVARCEAELEEVNGASAVVVRVTRDGCPPSLDDEVAATAAAAGVRIDRRDDALTLTFPAAAG